MRVSAFPTERQALSAVVEALWGGPVEFATATTDYGCKVTVSGIKKLACGCCIHNFTIHPAQSTTHMAEVAIEQARASVTRMLQHQAVEHVCRPGNGRRAFPPNPRTQPHAHQAPT